MTKFINGTILYLKIWKHLIYIKFRFCKSPEVPIDPKNANSFYISTLIRLQIDFYSYSSLYSFNTTWSWPYSTPASSLLFSFPKCQCYEIEVTSVFNFGVLRWSSWKCRRERVPQALEGSCFICNSSLWFQNSMVSLNGYSPSNRFKTPPPNQ